MKNILFISDNFLDGGLETRINGQIQEYQKQHLKTYLVCENFNQKHSHLFYDKLTDLPFCPKNNHYYTKDILYSKTAITSFCQKNHIDFIDCQPFWCILPATLAANECGIPISFTMHGTESGNFINENFLTAKIIYDLCLSYGFDTFFAVAEYLKDLYPYINTPINITRNGIDFKNININRTQNGNFAIASRLDQQKTDLIIKFLPILLESNIVKHIDIYGDGPQRKHLESFTKTINSNQNIDILGWADDLQDIFKKNHYDAIFGMGRVILDAISSGTPAGILGYEGFAGFLTKESFQTFLNTNLTSWKKLDSDTIKQQLSKLYEPINDFNFNDSDKAKINQMQIWKKHLSLCTKLQPTSKPSMNQLLQIFEINQNCDLLDNESLLDDLYTLFNNNHCQLQPFLLKKYLQNNLIIKRQQEEISSLLNSKSWRITKPLRFISKIKQHFN